MRPLFMGITIACLSLTGCPGGGHNGCKLNAPCDDLDPCTLDDRCAANGDCVGEQKDCDDGRACSADTCEPATGQCAHDTAGCLCATDADCDDADPCTDDVCDPALETCTNTLDEDKACDDGDACTGGDTCQADGTCAGAPVECDDDKPCTTDACAAGACTFAGLPVGTDCGGGLICDDQSACRSGCLIDGAFVADGEQNPEEPCYACDPQAAPDWWTQLPAGSPCSPGLACDADGWCSDELPCADTCGNHCGPGGETARSDVHIFYYPWYGNPDNDGQWVHWAAWDVYGNWLDPDQGEVTSAFYPALGPYSSTDDATIEQHMQWLEQAGVGVLVVSWWGHFPGMHTNALKLLDAADDHGLKVAFYIEPYSSGYLDTIRPVGAGGNPDGDRTPFTCADDVRYLTDTYGCHNGLYRVNGRPVFYFFAAREYQDGDTTDWNTVWSELHADPAYNPIVIAHDTTFLDRVIAGGWDGGHEYGCPWGLEAQWSQLAQDYAAAGKLLSAGVCPGYDDARFRLVGGPETDRQDGAYYDSTWAAVVSTGDVRPWAISLATFNEWHEGTQIEPAVPWTTPLWDYYDYEGAYGLTGAEAQVAYLDRTRLWADRFIDAAPLCAEATIDDAAPGGAGTCTNSNWNADGPGLLDCTATSAGGLDVIQGRYRQSVETAANLYLTDTFDLSRAVCAGHNVLELRIKITGLAHFGDGYLEIGNCMDCPAELQYQVARNLLTEDTWTTLRFPLGTHPNYPNVDWSQADHLRFYFGGTGWGNDPAAEAFRVQIDSVRIAW